MPIPSIKLSDDGNAYVTTGGVGPMLGSLNRYFLGSKGPSGFGAKSTSDQVLANWDGKGKVALITGSAGGLGFESARALASKGCEVIMTARDQAKAEAAVAKLKQLVPEAILTPMALDLSDLSSVKSFAEAYLATKKPIHILINNAAVMAIPKYTTTKDGIESQLGVNHFGHFALTNLLLPCVLETAKSSGVEGRIVTVASSAHYITYKDKGIRLQDYNQPKGYDRWGAYGQSKLANILFTRELALRLQKQDAPVATYTLHPGAIYTDLQRDMPLVERALFGGLFRPLLKAVPQGAATQLLAATAPSGFAPSGEFLKDCNVRESSKYAHDATLGRGLWELSETVTGVKAVV